jgi:hypothetical protein
MKKGYARSCPGWRGALRGEARADERAAYRRESARHLVAVDLEPTVVGGCRPIVALGFELLGLADQFMERG